ncbi:MAG: autotransporter-associated beta strand repeat-containing protein [Verrucomicrobia bacterium]|nr:autotransporter-associated beta strand repeat-containing protein [Verrucomicrobiota bacterium]
MKTTSQTNSARPGRTAMPRKIQRLRMVFGGVLAAVVVCWAGPARAAMGTWTGTAGATWDTTAADWSGVSGTPWDSGNGPANTALFTGSPTPSVSDTVYAGGFYVGSGSGISTTLEISNGTLNLGGGSDWVAIGGRRNGGVGTQANSCTLTISGGNVNFLNNGAATVFFNPYGGTASTLNLNGGTVSTVTGFTDGAGSGSNFNFNGGTLRFTASLTVPFNGAINLNVKAGGAILDTGGNNVTVGYGNQNTPLLHAGSGTDGGLTKLGTGTLTLIRANTYNGATTISNGTLAVSASGSLNAGSSVSIAAGATFDVSAYSTYTWGSGAGLTASGTSTPAILKGGSTGVNLGSRPATLNFTPTAFTGDSSRPALQVSAGTLDLGTSTITVNNNSATPLDAGDYTLITGTVSGTPTLNPVIGGAGLAASTSASLQFSGGNLILHVEAGFASTTTTLALQSPWTSTSTYGDALQFDVTVTGASPTGTVTVKDGGVSGTTLGAGTLFGGSVTVTLDSPSALTAGDHPNIVAVYSGDGSNNGSISTALTTQTVAKQELTIPDAAAQNKLYDGNNVATLTGTLAGVVSGDSVTLTLSGHFADAAPGTGKAVTSTSTIDVPSQANYTLTQPTGLMADILAFTWTNPAGGDWGTATNWLDSLIGDGAGNTSFFSTLDLTADTTVHLDSPRTVGALIFGDTDPSTAAGWLLDDGGSPDNTLTLAGTTPTIIVNALGSGKAVTIGVLVAGTAGLTKIGAGTLTLSAANTYSGTTAVRAGTLEVAAGGVIGNAGLISTVSGGLLQLEGTVTCTGHYYLGAGTSGSGTNIVNSGGLLNLGGSGVWVNIGGRTATGTGSNGTGTLTINGGSVNIAAGTTWYFNPYSNAGPSTLNLNGGTLSTAVTLTDGSGSGSSVNFNGGTYRFTAATTLPFNGALNLKVQPGGAILDTGGNNVTIGGTAQGGDRSFPLLHAGSGTDGGLTKTGAGTLTLIAANTYNGNTTVTAGELVFNAPASGNCLTFAVKASSNNKITGTGAATLNGPFYVDLSDASLASLTSHTCTLVDVATKAYGTNFKLTGAGGDWAVSSGVWTKTDGTKTWTFTEGSGELKLSSGGAYEDWATTNQGLTGGPGSDLDPAFDADPNKDSIQNGMAWILGAGALGDPAANLLKLPAVTRDGTGALVLTFDHLASSAASAPLVVQYGDDLGVTPWTDFTVDTAAGTTTDGNISIAVALGAGSTTDYDRITVTIPATYMTAHPKTFARLMANLTP